MVTFLTVFFFLYSLLHFYVFTRVRAALHPSPLVALGLALFMIAMITAPLIIRLSETAGWFLFGRIIAFVGYTWGGLLFLFVCVSLAIDAYRLALYLVALVSGRNLSFLALSAGAHLALTVIVVAVIAVAGWFDARNIRSEHVEIKTSKMSPGVSRVRIAQISDVHLGLMLGRGRLKRIVERVEKAAPDMLVSTGDLVDGQMNDLDGVGDLLKNVNARYGKFAVTGNHEFYAGLEQALAFTRRAGFRVLRGEVVAIPGLINVVGVDDPAGPGYGSSSKGEKELLSRVANGVFTLFLKHRPGVGEESPGLFDLQLSGHLHDGQIFPFRLIVKLFYPYMEGLYKLTGGSLIYVSRGTGTWGPPIRFLAPPEVTIIDLVR